METWCGGKLHIPRLFHFYISCHMQGWRNRQEITRIGLPRSNGGNGKYGVFAIPLQLIFMGWCDL